MNPEFGTLDPEMAEAVATAETSGSTNEPKVVGKGIYLELLSEDEKQTTQVIVTPEGINDKGVAVSMAIIYRTISDWSPRRQWRVSFVRPNKEMNSDENTITMTVETVKMIERQMNYGYKNLRNNTPIVFEVSNIDLTDVAEWKAPAPALRRVMKARTALGFPNELYNSYSAE
jgi:hypothetical protein